MSFIVNTCNVFKAAHIECPPFYIPLRGSIGYMHLIIAGAAKNACNYISMNAPPAV